MNKTITKKQEKDEAGAGFWLDNDLIDQYIPDKEKGSEKATFSLDLIQLAAYRRVISNFVSILTNKNIPVQFFSKAAAANFTDGKVVWLSSTIRQKQDFDWSVGLALHEGSHIKLSNFDVLKSMFMRVPLPLPIEIKKKAREKNISNEQLAYMCKWVFNFVEDRYVDSFIYDEAPGYRFYYQALYNQFWNSKEISEGIRSNMYRVPSLIAYEFRVINLTNPDTDLDALPGLRQIAEMISISNIFRLKSASDRMKLSIEVLGVILDNLGKQPIIPEQAAGSTMKKVHEKLIERFVNMFGDDPKPGDGKPDKDKNGKDNSDNSNKPAGSPGDSDDDSKSDTDSGDSKDDDRPSDKSGKSGEPKHEDPFNTPDPAEIQDKIEHPPKERNLANDEGDTSEFSTKELKKIREEFAKQQKILKHDYDSVKEEVSDSEQSLLDVIEKAGIVLVPAGFGMGDMNGRSQPLPGDYTQAAVDVIVVQKLTKELLESGRKVFPMAAVEHVPGGTFTPPAKYSEAVAQGFQLGRLLGKKLQVRGEINITKFIRKVSGKIERRLLHGIGAGMEDVFNKIHIEKFNKARLHLSVDASSSMAGDEKWLPTMKCVTAICVAASMVDNLSVSVSFRCTHNLSDGTTLPYVVMAYDSDKDKISKVRNFFPFLKAEGSTPEGLCFEAIMDKFIIGKKTDEQDHYFVNLSDGEPAYSLSPRNNKYKTALEYIGEAGVLHTKKQVEKIRLAGVTVMSYFISSQYDAFGMLGYSPRSSSGPQIPYTDTLKLQFQKMYGKDSRFINVTSLLDVAKTINQLFLMKD
jgi:hypothetical protein